VTVPARRTIAITGATGFAGRHAVSGLLARGHTLKALVRDPGQARFPAGVTVVKGDLGDAETLRQWLDGCDCAVHLAGVLAAVHERDYFRVNARGTVMLAEAAIRSGISRFVHVSSLAAREPQLSPYAASKRAGEDAVAKLAGKLNAIIIRPPAVYGPGDRGTLPLIKQLTAGIAVIPGNKEGRFSLVHARDLARFVADAVANELGGLHEIGDGKPGGYGWEDLAAIASAFRGRPVRPLFLPAFVPQTIAAAAAALARLTGAPGMISSGKVRELYHRDWVSREGTLRLADPIAFADGFAETVAWYREAGWLPPARGTGRTRPTSQ
jgi:nucleoside-diphosphate-sugar epimerase